MSDERAYGIAAPIAAKWPASTSALWVAMVRAGYLAALEDAAKACELQMMAEDGLPEADGACGACAAAVRAVGE